MKKLAYIASILILLNLFMVTAYAHPGRTDSNGGHYDRSTGEYHYHHGYSAHDHYDIDGDGKVDCPYTFDYKTDHSNQDSSTSTTDTEKPLTAWDIIKRIALLILMTLLSMCVMYFPAAIAKVAIEETAEKQFKVILKDTTSNWIFLILYAIFTITLVIIMVMTIF